jgi:hypothetical protein
MQRSKFLSFDHLVGAGEEACAARRGLALARIDYHVPMLSDTAARRRRRGF